jgi:hypothetical protein
LVERTGGILALYGGSKPLSRFLAGFANHSIAGALRNHRCLENSVPSTD